jgi:hypothetical protein
MKDDDKKSKPFVPKETKSARQRKTRIGAPATTKKVEASGNKNRIDAKKKSPKRGRI